MRGSRLHSRATRVLIALLLRGPFAGNGRWQRKFGKTGVTQSTQFATATNCVFHLFRWLACPEVTARLESLIPHHAIFGPVVGLSVSKCYGH